MTLVARYLREDSDQLATIKAGAVTQAFARASRFVCPHEDCQAPMRYRRSDSGRNGDIHRGRQAHFSSDDVSAHAFECPEGERTPQLRTIKSVCALIDARVPILVNLNFDTGFRRGREAADLTRSVGEGALTCHPASVWTAHMKTHRYERPRAHAAIAAHSVGEVVQLIDRVSKYRGGGGLDLLSFQSDDMVQSYAHFAVFDSDAGLKGMVRALGSGTAAPRDNVQLAPKLVMFRPSRRARDNRFESVAGQRITSFVPVSHYFDLHVRPVKDIGRRAFAEADTVTTLIARPYLLQGEAATLRRAIADRRGITTGYPLHLFMNVVDSAQFDVTYEPAQLPLALTEKPAVASVSLRLAAARSRADATRRGPVIG